jgi:hypothetical protein
VSPEEFKEVHNRNSGEKGHHVETDQQVLWSDSYRTKIVGGEKKNGIFHVVQKASHEYAYQISRQLVDMVSSVANNTF